MAIRTVLFMAPVAAVSGLVLLLNALDSGAGMAAIGIGLVAVATGTIIGYFADRLPELPRARRQIRSPRIALPDHAQRRR